jgi:hypothetical protein
MATDAMGRVVELLLPVLDDDGVAGWLNRPRGELGDRSPQQLLAAGDDDVVLAMAIALRLSA